MSPLLQLQIILWINVLLCACRCIKGEPAIEDYYEMYMEANECNSKMSEAVMQSPNAQQHLVPGRVVVMKSETVRPSLHLSFLWFIIYVFHLCNFTGHRQFTWSRTEGSFKQTICCFGDKIWNSTTREKYGQHWQEKLRSLSRFLYCAQVKTWVWGWLLFDVQL